MPKRGFGRCDAGHKAVDCNCQGCVGAERRRGISLSNQRRRVAVMLSATISPYTMVGRRAPYAIGLLAAVLLVMAGMADAASARSSGSQGSNLANTEKTRSVRRALRRVPCPSPTPTSASATRPRVRRRASAATSPSRRADARYCIFSFKSARCAGTRRFSRAARAWPDPPPRAIRVCRAWRSPCRGSRAALPWWRGTGARSSPAR